MNEHVNQNLRQIN